MWFFPIFVLAFGLAFPAYATTPAPHLLGLSITADEQATSLEIDLSARAALTTIVRNDRLEIDLPTAAWDRSFPAHGEGGGLIRAYRKSSIGHGIAIVLPTTTLVKIEESQGAAAPDGTQHITIRLVSAQAAAQAAEAQALAAQPVVVAPAVVETPNGLVAIPYGATAVGPTVQKVVGPGVIETVPAQAVQNQAPAAKPSTNCASHLVPAGRVGDATANYPVYKFSDCP